MFVDEKPIQRVFLDEADDGLYCWTATWSSTIRRWPLDLKLLNTDTPVQPNMILKGKI